MRGRWWLTWGAGCAAAAVVLVATAAGSGPREGDGAVAMPDRIAGYSHLTGTVSAAPPGRALALYQHGFGVEFLDFPQAVVLAADDDVYRRLDAAEDRSVGLDQGDPGPMLLAPGGDRVALGSHDASDAELAVVDLGTGEVERHDLPAARSVRPVAWDADAGRVAYLATDEPVNPYLGEPVPGRVLVLDLDTGRVEPLPATDEALAVAFAPDGRRVAVSGRAADGVEVVDLDTSIARQVSDGSLAGPTAWSADGLLAIRSGAQVDALDVSGATARVVGSTPLGRGTVEFLGWTGPREVALSHHDWSADNDRLLVVGHLLDASTTRTLTTVTGMDSFGVGRLELASALLPDLAVRPADPAQRGPWPLGLRLAAAVCAGLLAMGCVRVVGRRVRRHTSAGT